jgi:uncharacterized membrane protein SpoIIM required for sporulation/ABC-type transport system involved in multi-copper enzyme maturation permease subunit
MSELFSPVWLLAKRELRDQFRDWRILFPLLVLTFFFPLLTNAFAGQVIDFMNKYGGDLILDRMVPFSILIIGFFPVTVSLVVALEAFVGEKERGTIEPLLSSPILNWQLYFGKLFVGVFFPLSASYTGIAFYLAVISRQSLNLPPAGQIFQLLALTFAHAILMVSGAIVISTQATSVKAANLLASFIVVPVALLIQGESALLFWGDSDVLWWAVVGVLFLAAILMRLGIAHFQREYLLGREIDALNLKWMWETFRDRFVGTATSLGKWYQVQVSSALRRFRVSILIVLFLTVVSGVASYLWVSDIAPAYASDFSQEEIDAVFNEAGLTDALNLSDAGISFGYIFTHNVRATIAIFGMGAFSFGVLGELIYIINVGVIGGVFAALNYLGFSAFDLFLAGILPHGIFELPAIMLVSASVLYFGSVLITPNPRKTMGEVLIHALADWLTVFVGLVVPLLFVAALIETYITPQILLRVMQ